MRKSHISLTQNSIYGSETQYINNRYFSYNIAVITELAEGTQMLHMCELGSLLNSKSCWSSAYAARILVIPYCIKGRMTPAPPNSPHIWKPVVTENFQNGFWRWVVGFLKMLNTLKDQSHCQVSKHALFEDLMAYRVWQIAVSSGWWK